MGQGLGVSRRILVSPLLCFKHELHIGGICFQSRLQKSKRRDVFAEGGRYDRLLEVLASPGSRQIERSLVGATFAVSKLSRALASMNAGGSTKSRGAAEVEKVPRRCDVFIVSYTPGFIGERLLIARELWKQGIATDLVSDFFSQVASFAETSFLYDLDV
jgi:translation initiation factor 2-alpha kinase 4